jgi:hypothetical protein
MELCACCSANVRSFMVYKEFVTACGGVHRTADGNATMSVFEVQAKSLGKDPDMLMRELTVPRQYFHSKTGIPILPNEIDCDSDDDVDESWITSQSDRVSGAWCLVFVYARLRGVHNTTQHNTTQHNTTQHNTAQPPCALRLLPIFCVIVAAADRRL